MDSLINKIIKIEKRAQQIISDTKEEKFQMEKNIKIKIDETEIKINEMVDLKKEELIKKAHTQAEEKIVKLKLLTKKRIEKMEKDTVENMKLWEDSIYESLVKRG